MSNIYLSRFFNLNTAPDILSSKVFPNIKEITESMGAFVAVKDHIPYSISDSNVTCFVVGDGCTPRTGMLIARLTAWNVISIDPRMKIKDYKTKRLTCYKNKIEEITFLGFDKVVIISVHSHADTTKTVNAIKAKEKYFVNIPCCVPCNLKDAPIFEYNDEGILSKCNKVQVYNVA